MAGAGVVRSSHSGGEDREYPGNLTPYATVTCVVAATGGLAFGYDIGITGGVTSMNSFLEKFFPSLNRRISLLNSTSNNMYCKFNSHVLSLFVSSLFLAALLSTFVASTVTRRLGRKPSMLCGGMLLCVGAPVNAFARSVWMLIIARVLQGFGVGFVNQCVPLYLSEMAPYKYRGALNIGFQLSVTIGILVANMLNYFFVNIKDGWRFSLGGAIVPALIITVGLLVLPETPTSMIEHGKVDEAQAQLKRIRGTDNVHQEFDDLITASEIARNVEHPWRNLLQNKYRPHLMMAIAIPFFQQLTGINAIMFYSPLLFHMVSFESNASLVSATITGGVNVLATLVSIYIVDRWGRRLLFLQGGIQMLICQIAVAICMGVKFGRDGTSELHPWFAIIVLMFICSYVAGFAWSWGPLGWLVPSEIFPLEIRSVALSLSVSTNMFFTFVVAQVFLTMLCHLKFGTFLFFGFCNVVMTVFIHLFLPETKNIPIEEMIIVFPLERRRGYYVERALSLARVPNRS